MSRAVKAFLLTVLFFAGVVVFYYLSTFVGPAFLIAVFILSVWAAAYHLVGEE